MSKAIKNLLIAFTVLCAFVFVIFLIQLLVLNSGNGVGPEESQSVSGAPATGGGSPTPGQPGTTGNTSPEGSSPSGGLEPSGNTDPEGSQAEPDGTIYEFEMPEDLKLTLFVKEETREQQFSYIEYESEDEPYVLKFNGNGTAALELRYAFLKDGIGAYAAESLDKFVGSGGTEVIGETTIRGSGLRGTAVTATKDRMTYEGWIYSFSGIGLDDVGFEIVIYYTNDLQKNALYDILDTLKMVSGH